MLSLRRLAGPACAWGWIAAAGCSSPAGEERVGQAKQAILQVGPELAADDPVVTPGSEGARKEADVASNGTISLVVWTAEVGTDQNVHAARVAADGTVLDPLPIVLAANPAVKERRPSVASDGTDFFVVWDGYDGQARGTRVSAAGQILDPAGIPIGGANSYMPDVAFGAGVYMVAYWRSSSLRAVRISTSGQILDAMPPLIAPGANYAYPKVASNGADFFVAFVYITNILSFQDLYGVRISGGGAVLDPSPVPIDVSPPHQSDHDVASDGNGYIVVYGSAIFNAPPETYSVLVSAAGAVSPPLLLAANGNSPSVGHDGAHYFVSWFDVASTDLLGRRLDSAAAPIEASPFTVASAPMAQHAPAVTAAPGGFLAAWQDSRNGPNTELFATTITSAGVVSDPAGVLVGTGAVLQANAEKEPAVATNGTLSLAVWEDERLPGMKSIYAARLTADGQTLDPGGIDVASGGQNKNPAVATDGTDFLVVWENASSKLGLRRVGADGSVGPAYQHDPLDGDNAASPAVAFDGARYLATYGRTNGQLTADELYGVFALPSGEPDGAALLLADHSEDPALVYDGASYLVSFHYTADHAVQLVRLTPGGQLLGPPLSVPALSWAERPSVAFDGNLSLVVWDEASNVLGARVSPQGALLDLQPIVISAGAWSERSPTVTRGPAGFLVAWEDQRAGATATAIYGAEVSGNGQVLDPSGFPIASLARDNDRPAATTVGTQPLLVYERNDPTPGVANTRVRARLLAVASGGGAGGGGSGGGGSAGVGGSGSGSSASVGGSGSGSSASVGGSGVGGNGAGGSMGGGGDSTGSSASVGGSGSGVGGGGSGSSASVGGSGVGGSGAGGSMGGGGNGSGGSASAGGSGVSGSGAGGSTGGGGNGSGGSASVGGSDVGGSGSGGAGTAGIGGGGTGASTGAAATGGGAAEGGSGGSGASGAAIAGCNCSLLAADEGGRARGGLVLGLSALALGLTRSLTRSRARRRTRR